MLRSQDLRQKIKIADQTLEMMRSPGWQNFLDELVHPMGERAFKDWKKTPAEKSWEVIELQMMGKFADIIEAYPNQLTKNLEKWMNELKLILEGEEEDTAIPD